MPFIELKEITKVYGQKEIQIVALQQVSFALEKNELVVILGASGAGKSTLLNILGGMDYATSGSYKMNGKDITQLNEKKLAQFRRRQIGFVFQFYNLMPNLTALENVRLSIEHLKDVEDPKHTLEMVGLGHRMHNFPSHLSGGEQQRVSIARAIVKKPDLLLCDEPTGALDSQTGKHILRLLKSISETGKQCVVIVTHNASIAEVANRVIRFSDGKLVSNQINLHPKDIEEIEW